jgi:hypothetical protein
MAEDNKADLGDAVSWWVKNKNKVYAAILVIVGVLGGNADRVNELLPTVEHSHDDIVERLDNLEGRVIILEDSLPRFNVPD